MNKNIIRSIFWGTIALISLILGIMGLIYNNRILNIYKSDLQNITTLFNNATVIRNYEEVNTKITASVKGKKIIVKTDGILEDEYIYKLKRGYLEITVSSNDSLSRIITMVLADSVAITKGQEEGDTYPLFNNGDTLNYKLEDGISYTLDKENYIIRINLDNYIVKQDNYIDENEIPEDNTDTDINEETENEEDNDEQIIDEQTNEN